MMSGNNTSNSSAMYSSSGSGEITNTTDAFSCNRSTSIIICTTEQVWLVLPSLGGIFLISIVFIVIVLVCKRAHRKKDRKYVHQQQKRRNGSKGSVYFVQGQGIELQSARARSSEFVNVLESVQSVGDNDQVDLVTNNAYETVDEAVAPVQNEHDVRTGQVIQQEAESSEQDGCLPDAFPGENKQFSRRSDTRSSVRSDSKILDNRRLEPELDNTRSQFSRQMSTRMSTRSEAGDVSKKTRFVSSQQSQSQPRLKELNTRTFQEAAEDSYCPDGSMERMQKYSIHQVQSPTLQSDNRIPIDGLAVKINSPFEDIPSFRDPELTGDGDDFKNTLVLPPPPPDIYSSQILDTGEQVEETEESSFSNQDQEGGASESVFHRRTPDRIISIDPPVDDSDDDEPIHPDPRYSCIFIKSRPQSVEDPENLYDEPIIVNTPNNERLLLAAPIFDDPGYDRGFKGLGATAETLEENEPHHYHTLEPPFTSNEASQLEATGKKGQEKNMREHRNGDLNGHLSDGLAASEIKKNQQVNKSTLDLLDFCEEELQELDPDLFSHLQKEDNNYAM